MNCPKCNSFIPDGSMYCEKCGTEIVIVPVFETDLEDSISDTFDQIRGEIFGNESKTMDEKQQEQKKSQNQEHQKLGDDTWSTNENHKIIRNRWIMLALAILFMFSLVALFLGIKSYRSSYVYLSNVARECIETEEYDKALDTYDRLIKLQPENILLLQEKAQLYLLNGDQASYENLLLDITQNVYATKEQIRDSYEKLLAIYIGREDYVTVYHLLQVCDNTDLTTKYAAYLCTEVTFSVSEGFYDSIQILKLSTEHEEAIYYTVNGADPVADDTLRYQSPIVLEQGEYVVKAFSENAYGISSDIKTYTFHIEADSIAVPDVSLFSGEYTVPETIEATTEDELCRIFYTVDGTDPTEDSILYQNKIYLPLGKSSYKFICIRADGMKSDIIEREYQLELVNGITLEQSHQLLMEYEFSKSKIFDLEGLAGDNGERYQYDYQFVVHIDNSDDFYIYKEYFVAGQERNATGCYMAVNVYYGYVRGVTFNETSIILEDAL